MKVPYRKSLLCGSSMLALNTVLAAAVLLIPSQAHAVCTAVSTDTTISNSATSCVTWTGGNLSITSSGVLSGASTEITYTGTIGNNLTNSGIIGGTRGVVNNGIMGTIVNSGSISSIFDILNQSIIGSVSNTGTLNGVVGLFNNGTISSVSNTSTISTGNQGMVNAGSIGTLSNSSLISSGFTGIGNSGILSLLTNSGTISGNSGIGNSGTIGAVNNSSLISGGSAGINNGLLINTITNSGTITANIGIFNNTLFLGTIVNSGTIAGSSIGILNTTGFGRTGSITSIRNNGLISGPAAISSNGTILSALSNAGTIAGSISVNQILTITGGSAGTLGTLTGYNGTIGTISTNNHNLIFDTNAHQLLSEAIDVGSSTVTNNGAIQVNTAQSITGNYAQTSGNLIISGTGKLLVSGTVAVSGGTITDSVSSTGNYLTTDAAATIIQGGAGSSYTSITLAGAPTGLAVSLSTISNALVASYGNDYVGGNLSSLTNSGNLSNAGPALYVAATGTLGTLTNSGTINGSVAINNVGGTIGSIANAGLISGGISSSGIITSALSNSGTIEGSINVAQALTITGGSLTGLGMLTGFNGTIGAISTSNHNLIFDNNANQLLDDDIVVGASNTVFNNGLIRANTAHTITGNYNQGAGSTLVVGVTDASHYGQLIISGAATMTGSNVLIAPTSGSLTAGESFTIVQAAISGTSYSGVVATASGFAVTTSSITAGGNEDLIIDLSTIPSGGGGGANTYMNIGQQTGDANGQTMGAVLDQLQNQVANGSIAGFAPILTALNNIGTQQGVAAEGAAIKQLVPGQLGAGVMANNLTAIQSMSVIGQHQQNMRDQTADAGSTGKAAGSEYMSGAFWMQIDGGFANSTAAGAGYHQSYYGITFGADDHINKNATVGVAVGWAHNNANGSNNLSGNSVTTSTPELMGYGSYRLGQAYVDAMFGIGYNMFDQTRSINFLNAAASSSYGGMQYMGSVETGYDFMVAPKTTLTPLIGFNAVRTDTDGYTESGAGAANTSVGRQIIDSYATSLGGRFTTEVPTPWGNLIPEAKLAWTHDLNGSPIATNATLQGVNFATTTPRADQDGAAVSLATTFQYSDTLSVRAEYDGDLRSDLQSHTGLLKGEWKF